MTEPPIKPQGAALWDNIENKTLPYSIMFAVEDNCPVYIDNYRDWVEYFVEAWPSDISSYFITEGKFSLNIFMAAASFYVLFEYCKEVMEGESE